MANWKGIGLIAIALVIAVLLILGLSLLSGVPVYTIQEKLASNPNTPYTPNSWFITSFNDSRGVTVARLEILIPSGVLPTSNNSFSIMVSVWHLDATHLDSLKLTFSTLNMNLGPNVWFDTPEGTQSSNVLVYKDHGNSVVYIPDMGFMGRRSVNFDLYIQIPRPSPISGSYPLTIQASLSLHESDNIFSGASYVHTTGYPIVGHSFSADTFVAFLIDSNGNVSKYNIGYI